MNYFTLKTSIIRMTKILKRIIFRLITIKFINAMILCFAFILPERFRVKIPIVKNLKFEIGKNDIINVPSDGGDSIINNIFWKGGLDRYEPDTMRLINKYKFPVGNYFDIGANSGIYSLMLAKFNPGAVIHAFEPVPRNLKYFKKYIASNNFSNIKLNDVALSDKTGEIEFNFQDSITLPLGGSLRDDISNPDLKIIVKTITLNSYVLKNSLESVDFIKIDTEGAENEVLCGALDTIKKYKPIIVLEVLPILDTEKLTSLMKDLNYSFYRITEESELPVKEIIADNSFQFKNYLFIPKIS